MQDSCLFLALTPNVHKIILFKQFKKCKLDLNVAFTWCLFMGVLDLVFISV